MVSHHTLVRRFLGLGLLAIALLMSACAMPLAEQRPNQPPSPPATASSSTAALPTVAPPTVAPPLPTTPPAVQATSASATTPATSTPAPTLPAEPTAILPLIAIDPGHGGRDLGARHFRADGHMDLYEAEVNLDLALRLRDLLLAQGYRVLMTRDGDYGLNPESLDLNGDGIVDHVDELQIRLDMINEAGADLLVSIHQNAYYEGPDQPAIDVGGVVTFYCQDRTFGEQNLVLGQAIHAELLNAFAELGHDIMDRGVLDDLVLMTADEPGTHLIVLGPESDRIVRPSQMPGILSETLFITHDKEAALIQRPEARQRLAQAYAAGITQYLNQTKVDSARP